MLMSSRIFVKVSILFCLNCECTNLLHIDAMKSNLLEVIESLTPLTTSRDTKDRVNGYIILQQCIENISDIPEKEAGMIASFLSSRLKDETLALLHVIKIIQEILRKQRIPIAVATDIFSNISRCIPVPQQPHDVRYAIYQLVGLLTKSKEDVDNLRNSLDEFVLLFSQVGEGERDPRCLLLLFHLFRPVISSIPDLGPYAEEVFDNVGCYFPVAYIPPKDDPYAISREDLAGALSTCLGCHPQFGSFFFQLIMEKLGSDREVAKIDSYQALNDCLISLGPSQVKPFLSILWAFIRTDCLNTSNHPTLKLAATSVMKPLMTVIEADDEAFESISCEITSDLQPFLTKKDLGLQQEASDLLTSIACSRKAYRVILPKTISQLFASLPSDQSSLIRIFLADFLCQIFGIRYHSFIQQDGFSYIEKVLELILNQNIKSGGDQELEFKNLELLRNILDSPIVLSNDDYGRVNSFLCAQFNLDHHKDVWKALAEVVNSLTAKGKLTIAQDLHILFTQSSRDYSFLLQHLSMPNEWYFQTLCSLNEKLIESDSQKILSLTTILLSKISIQDDEKLDQIFNNIAKVYQNTHIGLAALYFLSSQMSSAKRQNIVCNICEQIFPNQGSTDDLFTVLWCLVEGSKSFISSSEWIRLIPLLKDSNGHQLMLLESLIRKGSDDIVSSAFESLHGQDNLTLLKHLTRGLCHRSHPKMLDCLATIYSCFGKSCNAAEAIIFLHEQPTHPLDLENFGSLKPQSVNPFYHQRLFFQTLPFLTNSLEKIVEEERQLCGDTPGELQKLESKKDELKQAIIGQLLFLPRNVVRNDIKKIHSLIISSLSSEGSTKAFKVSVECLFHLLEDKSCVQLISSNLNSIVASLVKNSVAGDSLVTRQTCLKCLTRLTKILPEKVLLTQRSYVIKEIQSRLDDPKRLVRIAASEARHSWILIGQPGNVANSS